LASPNFSGASSSSVGTYAGQVVMGGFLGRSIPLGLNSTSVLVLSQVVLSFGIPLALVPLVTVTSRRDVMGVHVNRRPTTIIAWACVILISALNVFLIYRSIFG
jgi:manganese transport protein